LLYSKYIKLKPSIKTNIESIENGLVTTIFSNISARSQFNPTELSKSLAINEYLPLHAKRSKLRFSKIGA